MESDARQADIRVEVAYATPEKQALLAITAPAGCTVAEAIERSGIRQEFPDRELDLTNVGIFSRKANLGDTLRDGDRVEIYRPLLIDPKELRKQRARNAP
jgi:putative ubiquitin-RnfH superfamily antitoxin RatB of RatAB toxin-antitoxin module